MWGCRVSSKPQLAEGRAPVGPLCSGLPLVISDHKKPPSGGFCNQSEPIRLDGLLFAAQSGKQRRDELGQLGGHQREVGIQTGSRIFAGHVVVLLA